MTSYTYVVSDDWIPRYRDAGYAALIRSLAPFGQEIDDFLNAAGGGNWPGGLNVQGSQPEISQAMFLELYADLSSVGDLPGVQVKGDVVPDAVTRLTAPSAIGNDGSAAWVAEGNANAQAIRWYVNGAFATEKVRSEGTLDLSVALADIGATSGDALQACFVDGEGVVGWWVRTQL